MAHTADMATDRAFFKRNADANVRVRQPAPGEVDELAAHLLPAGAAWDGGFAFPPGYEPRVMAIKMPMRRIARVLSFVEAGAPAPHAGFNLMPIALGDRLAIA